MIGDGMMKVNVIMFSPAGGTAKTAEKLASALGTLTGAVDIAEPDVFYGGIKADPEAIAIVAMPCYGGRVAAPMVYSAMGLPPTRCFSTISFAFSGVTLM